MFFEYPKLLWLLLVPFLLVLRYLYIELKDRRPHFRVSRATPWKAGGRSVLSFVRHIPFILRTAALCLIVVAIARQGGHRGNRHSPGDGCLDEYAREGFHSR